MIGANKIADLSINFGFDYELYSSYDIKNMRVDRI